MKIFYVMGGGYGHLYRVRVFIDQLRISEYRIVTNNPLVKKLFSQDEILFIEGKNPQQLTNQIHSIIKSNRFRELYIDTFPAGIFGELEGVGIEKVFYLARRLRWRTYQPLLTKHKIHFDKTYFFEELEPEHAEFARSNSGSVERVELNYPEPDPSKIPLDLIPQGKPIWLIVHAFIHDEVETLITYAKEIAILENQEPAVIVITDQPVQGKEFLSYSYFPASDWFPLADRIFTGGGFNILNQGTAFAEKITTIPFPRKYDDQTWRVMNFGLKSNPQRHRVAKTN